MDPDSKVLNMRITRFLIRYTLYIVFNRENGLSFEIDVFQELKTPGVMNQMFLSDF